MTVPMTAATTAPLASQAGPLLEVRGLVVRYGAGRGGLFRRPGSVAAVRGIDFAVGRDEVFGLVGESGSGKSSVAKALLGIHPPAAGTVDFDGRRLDRLTARDWRSLRREVQYVFQDPLAALDPRMTALDQVAEPLAVHGLGTPRERLQRAAAMLDSAGLGSALHGRFPHELSGGQRQRVVIARALVLRPRLLVCDEPVSALDVSMQAQVVALLQELRRELGLSLLFISHDLALVRHLCDRVAVLYLGRIVEQGPVESLFRDPRHPYTQALVSAVPWPDPSRRLRAVPLPGEPPSPLAPPSGCAFRPRCARALPLCAERSPAPVASAQGREVACHLAAAAPR